MSQGFGVSVDVGLGVADGSAVGLDSAFCVVGQTQVGLERVDGGLSGGMVGREG